MTEVKCPKCAQMVSRLVRVDDMPDPVCVVCARELLAKEAADEEERWTARADAIVLLHDELPEAESKVRHAKTVYDNKTAAFQLAKDQQADAASLLDEAQGEVSAIHNHLDHLCAQHGLDPEEIKKAVEALANKRMSL